MGFCFSLLFPLAFYSLPSLGASETRVLILSFPSEHVSRKRISSEIPSKGRRVRHLFINCCSLKGNFCYFKIAFEILIKTLVKSVQERFLRVFLSWIGISDKVTVPGSFIQASGGDAEVGGVGEISHLLFNVKCSLGILNLTICLLKPWCANEIILSINLHLGVKEKFS